AGLARKAPSRFRAGRRLFRLSVRIYVRRKAGQRQRHGARRNHDPRRSSERHVPEGLDRRLRRRFPRRWIFSPESKCHGRLWLWEVIPGIDTDRPIKQRAPRKRGFSFWIHPFLSSRASPSLSSRVHRHPERSQGSTPVSLYVGRFLVAALLGMTGPLSSREKRGIYPRRFESA